MDSAGPEIAYVAVAAERSAEVDEAGPGDRAAGTGGTRLRAIVVPEVVVPEPAAVVAG